MFGRTAPPALTGVAFHRYLTITGAYLCTSTLLFELMDYRAGGDVRLFLPPAGAAFGYLAVVGARGVPAVMLAGVLGILTDSPRVLVDDSGQWKLSLVLLPLGLWLCAAVLRRARRPEASFAALAWFVLCGVIAAPLVSASNNVALSTLGQGAPDLDYWARSVLGYATAIATLAPAVMLLAAPHPVRRAMALSAPARARLEATAQALAIMFAPTLLTLDRIPGIRDLSLLPLALVPVLWVAVSRDITHSALCLAATGLVLGASTRLRFGESQELYHTQVLMLASALATMFIAATLLATSRTRSTAELAARQWSALVAAAPATIARVGQDGAWRLERAGTPPSGLDHEEVVSHATEVPELALAVAATQEGTVHWRVRGEPTKRFVTHITPLPDGEVLTVTTETSRARSAEAELAWERTHDRETELANRDLLLAIADRALVDDVATSLILIEADGLSRGAALVGADPAALRVTLADRIRSTLATSATGDDEPLIARTGDDQFGVVVLTDLMTARRQAARIRAALDGPLRIDGHRVPVSAFAGVAAGDHERGARETLRQAAIALQAARESGRGAVVVFDGFTQSSATERARLASEVVAAVERRELDLVFQPDVDLARGRLTGVEALVRWKRRQGYAAATELLVRLAEESGAAPDLDAWVMEQSLRQVGSWRRMLDGHRIELGLNVSALSLCQELPERLVEACGRHAVPTEHVRLEVTETALGDEGHAAAVLERARAMGFRIALDDFGTGYASLSRLRKLPIDVLKLDRSFMPALTNDVASQALVSLVLGLAEPLEVEVLAEGVETPAQRDLLIDMGCRRAQGFLFAAPAPAGVIARDWLSTEVAASLA